MEPFKKRLTLLALTAAAATLACGGEPEPERPGFSARGPVFDLATAVGPRPQLQFSYDPSQVDLSDDEVQELVADASWFESDAGARIPPSVSVATIETAFADSDSRVVRIEPSQDLPEGWSRFVAGAALEEVFELTFKPSDDPEARRTMRLHRGSLPLPRAAAVMRDDAGVESLILLFSESVRIPDGTRFHDHVTVTDPDGADLGCQRPATGLTTDAHASGQWILTCDPLPESFSVVGTAAITSPEGIPVKLLDSSEPGFEIRLKKGSSGLASWRHD